MVSTKRKWRLMAGIFGPAALLYPAYAQEGGNVPPPLDPAAYADWSGPYLGLGASAGGAYGRYRLRPFTVGGLAVPGVPSGFNGLGDRTNWQAGVFAGHLWQRGPIVWGVEGHVAAGPTNRPFDFGDATSGPIDAIAIKREALGGLRGRLGWTFDDYLVYGTAGLAVARHRVTSVPALPFAGRPTEDLGFSYGFGIEMALTPNWAFGIDYQRSRFEAAGPAFFGLPRVRTDTDDVVARLTFRPDGMRLAPEPKEEPEGQVSDWSLHGQTTFIQQATPNFRSPYRGEFSFVPNQSRQIWTLTGYLGRRLWEGAELYYNPELNQGFGLSGTLGIAGYINGEAQKAGAPYPKLRSQRYFIRQTFGLGGETESVPDGLNQMAGTRDIDRVTVTVGKFAVGDYFDDNAYAHDPRTTFNNWALWASAAYDAPANLPGFTQGAVVELNRKDWAVRGGLFQVPKAPNSDIFDPRITKKGGAALEFEQRFSLFEQPGKLRVGVFSNVGRGADYRYSLAYASVLGADPNDVSLATRGDKRKSGFYVNLEKAITDDLGMFARASWNDGKSEILSFTDIDRSLSGGFALKGTMWDRPKDTIGIGTTFNTISKGHREYLAAGGLGLLIGDGRLSYAPERAFEAYYKVNLTGSIDLTFDYQLVVRPGYNSDRGPVNLFATRLHAEF